MPSEVIWEHGLSRLIEIVAKVEAQAEIEKHEALKRIYEESQARVPVATADELSGDQEEGALKASGRIEGDTVVYGGGDQEVGYAGDVEYGTRHMAAEPYLTPAAEQEAQHFGEAAATGFRAAMRL